MKRSLLLALALVGCAGKASVSTRDTTANREAATPAAQEPAPDSAATSMSASSDSAYLGVVDRAGLVAIVEQGLGHVLARLKLSPVMDGKRFRGFRVTALDSQWQAAGIQVGDVIVRLNGQPIERPEQAMVAFESLRVASEIALELDREGQKTFLRYRVE